MLLHKSHSRRRISFWYFFYFCFLCLYPINDAFMTVSAYTNLIGCRTSVISANFSVTPRTIYGFTLIFFHSFLHQKRTYSNYFRLYVLPFSLWVYVLETFIVSLIISISKFFRTYRTTLFFHKSFKCHSYAVLCIFSTNSISHFIPRKIFNKP